MSPANESSVGLLRAVTQILGALLLVAIGAALHARSGLNHDVAWYLQVARSAASGAPYYVDRPGSYLDINPPLVVWTLLPPLWLASRLGWPMTIAPTLLISVELLLSFALTRAVLRRTDMGPALTWGILAVGLVVVGGEFAQREHQAVLLLYPALVMLVAVPDAARLPRWLRICVGLSLGLGLAFKPHFVLAWALFELSVAAYDRRPWQALRIEVLAAAGVVIAYTACVLLFTPGYLPLLREYGPLYLRWLSTPVRILAYQPECVLSILALMLAARVRAAGEVGRTAFVFAMAGTAFVIAVLVQGKGFSYHWYPAMAFGVISVAASLRALEYVRAGWGTSLTTGAIAVLMLLLVWVRIADGLTLGGDRRRLESAIAAATMDSSDPSTRPSDGLAIISTRLVDAFPTVTDLNLEWAQRWPSLWVIEAAAPVACVSPEAVVDRAREQRVRDDLWEDLLRAQPRTIVVQPLPRSMHRRPGCRTLADHLAREPRFASFFAAYDPSGTIRIGRDAAFTVLRRRDPGPAVSGRVGTGR